jgi:hypothetical protein
MNRYMRQMELRNSRIICELPLQEKAKSYCRSPFAQPDKCGLLVVPSPISLVRPDANSDEYIGTYDGILFGDHPLQCQTDFHKINDPRYLYAFSATFRGVENYLDMFYETFPAISKDVHEECTLIRLDIRSKCVLFRSRRSFCILTEGQYVQGRLHLLATSWPTSSLKDSFISKQFGRFSMFCGHFVLNLPDDDFIAVYRYIYACSPHAFEIFTHSAGSFILSFASGCSLFHKFITKPPDPIESQKKWLSKSVSSFEYIMKINRLGNRSVNDLSAYPAFPRIIHSFTETWTRRNLSKPIDVCGDPEHVLISRRFLFQKFHHVENISHGLCISTYLDRISPFCRVLWDLNSGLDAGDRTFRSIPDNLGITKNTVYEITPEFFCAPEFFMNLHDFILPSGKRLDLELPPGIKTIFHFIRKHWKAFESTETRKCLHSWIDLLFGFASRGKVAVLCLNLFNPLSYCGKTPLENQSDWIVACGQVPARVFKDKHPAFDGLPIQSFHISAVSSEAIDYGESSLYRNLHLLGSTLRSSILEFVKHVSVSHGQNLVVVTTTVSEIYVFRLLKGQFMRCATMVFDQPQFSYLYEEQSLCYTVCLGEVVGWLYSNSSIVIRIALWNVKSLVVNNFGLFLSAGDVLYEYSISGRFVRKLNLGCEISVLSELTGAFVDEDLLVVVGSISGDVLVIKDDDSGDMVIDRREIIKSPVTGIHVDGTEIQVTIVCN